MEFLAGISMDVKLKGFKRKYILKHSMGNLLPDELLSARKRGFSMPENEWYGKNALSEIYSSSVGRLKETLNLNGIVNGRDQRLDKIFHGDSFWTLMALADKL